MRFIFEESESLMQLREALALKSSELFLGMTPVLSHQILKIGAGVEALSSFPGVVVLSEGNLSISLDQQELIILEEGDLLLTSQLSAARLSVAGDFAVKYDGYSWEQLTARTDQVARLFACVGMQQALISHLVATLHKGERRVAPAVRTLKKGETVVVEGEVSDQVFTLIEGHAEVVSGGEVVGEVRADELIGVIGALCGVPRIATVRTTTDALVMSLGKEDFIDLLSLRPQTVIKLISDFARIISSSNQALRSQNLAVRAPQQ